MTRIVAIHIIQATAEPQASHLLSIFQATLRLQVGFRVIRLKAVLSLGHGVRHWARLVLGSGLEKGFPKRIPMRSVVGTP